MMNSLRNRLQQSNTWLLIAILALLGWTYDALRMFLTMHDTLSAGLGAFAGHFWYALPMLIAVFALKRLQPKVRLLGLMAYDDAGELVHQRGDFHLDEFILHGALSSVDQTNREGLQSLVLPSGATVYFLRQNGITVVASFTGSASPQELAASIRTVNSSDLMHFDFVHDLEPSVAVLARPLLASPLKRATLTYFWQRKTMSTEFSDLIYWTHSDVASLTPILEEFVSRGLVQCRAFEQVTFYRLTSDPATLGLLEQLFTWIEQWRLTLQQVEQKIT